MNDVSNTQRKTRPLVLQMQISVDGFVGNRDGEVGWVFKASDDQTKTWIMRTLSETGLHIMGSRTFKDMAAWWPKSSEAFAAPMNDIPKAVFTRKGIEHATGTPALADATRAHGEGTVTPSPAVRESWAKPLVLHDLERDIARLKQEGGKMILAHGGAGFAQSLAASGLIDEYRLLVHPIALGAGKALFSALAKPLALKLVNATACPNGVVAKTYRPA